MIVALKVWTHPRSAVAGLLVAAATLLWPALPLKSLAVWYATLTAKFPTNVLYPLFALLVGSYAALYVYDRTVARCCRVSPSKAGAVSSVPGALLGFCPTCLPVLAFFLPLSLTITVGYYSWLILLSSIALLLFAMWRAGAFQKV